jgi:tartrate dehydratase beta subunit/fumarate hydratase class I family protein
MPALAVPLWALQAGALTAVGVAVALAGALGYRAWRRSRVTPEERERRRRAALVGHGKLTDATLVEINQNVRFYSYVVRGVEYTASQDISGLRAHMPSELGLGVGSVSVKFDAKIPANSIVIAEDWSGLHTAKVG